MVDPGPHFHFNQPAAQPFTTAKQPTVRGCKRWDECGGIQIGIIFFFSQISSNFGVEWFPWPSSTKSRYTPFVREEVAGIESFCNQRRPISSDVYLFGLIQSASRQEGLHDSRKTLPLRIKKSALFTKSHADLIYPVQLFLPVLPAYKTARFVAQICLNWQKLKKTLFRNGFSLWILVEQPPGPLCYEKWQIFFLKSVELPRFFRSAKIGLQDLWNGTLSFPPDSRNAIITSARSVKTRRLLGSGLISFKKLSFNLESTPITFITSMRPVSQWD